MLLCACGPKDGGDGDATASSDATATGTAGDTVDPPTTGDPPTTTATDTGDPPPTSSGPDTGTTDVVETTGEVCEKPLGDPLTPSVEIKITNGGATQVYVDRSIFCFSVNPFDILGPDMTEQKTELGSFEFTCDEAQIGECGRNPGCPIVGQAVQLDPGATLTVHWDGGTWTTATLSETCAEQFCGGCWIAQQAPAGTYTVRVGSATSLDGCDGPCQACVANPDGTCTAEGSRAENTLTEVVLDYPAQTSVEVIIP